MVVAVALLAAVAAALAATLRSASRSVERGEEEARETARLRAGIEVVTRTLRSSDPTPRRTAAAPAPFFAGEEARLRFVAPAPVGSRKGAPRLVCLFEAISPGDGEGGLALGDAAPFRPGGADGWEGTEGARIVLPRAAKVSFAYSPGAEEDGSWTWLSTWDAAERHVLPGAVRVTFETPSAAGPVRTSFVVPLVAGGGGLGI